MIMRLVKPQGLKQAADRKPEHPAPIRKRLIDSVEPGDTVAIVTPHGSWLKGRAVMRTKDGDGWVLNGGGRHGTPLLAYDSNCCGVRKRKT